MGAREQKGVVGLVDGSSAASTDEILTYLKDTKLVNNGQVVLAFEVPRAAADAKQRAGRAGLAGLRIVYPGSVSPVHAVSWPTVWLALALGMLTTSCAIRCM